MLANVSQPQIGASGAVVAVIAILVACVAAGGIIANVVVLTPSGITYHERFRTRMIEWESVESIGVARLPGVLPWSILIIETRPLGSVRIKNVAGSGRFVGRIAAEFEEFRAKLNCDPSPKKS